MALPKLNIERGEYEIKLRWGRCFDGGEGWFAFALKDGRGSSPERCENPLSAVNKALKTFTVKG